MKYCFDKGFQVKVVCFYCAGEDRVLNINPLSLSLLSLTKSALSRHSRNPGTARGGVILNLLCTNLPDEIEGGEVEDNPKVETRVHRQIKISHDTGKSGLLASTASLSGMRLARGSPFVRFTTTRAIYTTNIRRSSNN